MSDTIVSDEIDSILTTLFSQLIRYIWSGLIVVAGIYLNVYSKRSKLTFTDLLTKAISLGFISKDKQSLIAHKKDSVFNV